MQTQTRMTEVLARLDALEAEQKGALAALADGRGDLAAYAATVTQRAAIADVLDELRRRAHAERIAPLEAAAAEAEAVWASAHTAATEARLVHNAAIEARRAWAAHRQKLTPEGAAERDTIEHAVVTAETAALLARAQLERAGRALQEARAELEAAKGSEA